MITAVTNLVAVNSTSGGIFISNTGALTIGFTGDPFQGVNATGATGDRAEQRRQRDHNHHRRKRGKQSGNAPSMQPGLHRM